MIRANSVECKTSLSGSIWFTGKKPEAFTRSPQTARAREIARSREELLGLLKELPESDYELSLTDLVESEESKESLSKNSKSFREGESSKENSLVVTERKKTSHSRTSFGSSEGVLLNMYMPSSLTRSLTCHSSRGSSRREIADFDKREKDQVAFKCWSAIWERRKRRSRRQADVKKGT